LVLVVELLTVAILLFLVQELFRRTGKWAAWGVFLVLPMALTPYWFRLSQAGLYPEAGIFPWVKLYSLQIAACWLTALRFTSLGQLRWALGMLFLMLPINMLEAMTRDLFGGHLAHYLLVLSGGLLILSIPHPFRAIQLDTVGRYREVRYVGMTRTWIAGYSLWNAAFVYLNFPALTGHQLAVLASAFVVGMVDPTRWPQSRTFTLAFDLLVISTFQAELIPLLNTSYLASPQREDVVAVACLTIVVVCTVSYFLGRKNRSAK